MLAVNKVSRAAAERKRERYCIVFTGWAVGHAILRKEVQVHSARPPHRPKNRKKCDETDKKRGEPATGAFFEPKKRGGGSQGPLPLCCAAVHGRAANSCSSLPPSIGPGRILLFSRLSAVGKNAKAGLFVGSPFPCHRRGRVKIFHRGSKFLFDTL